MLSVSLFNALIQAVAAIVIFILGYFALLLCAIFCMLVVTLAFKAARLLWSHFSQAAGPAGPASRRAARDLPRWVRLVASMNRHLAAEHKSGP